MSDLNDMISFLQKEKKILYTNKEKIKKWYAANS